jgi:hypothetical protein
VLTDRDIINLINKFIGVFMMMKLMMINLFVLLFTSISFAEDAPPCWMDCPNSVWELDHTTIPLSSLGCQLPFECQGVNIEITFWRRHAECPDGMNPPDGTINAYDCQVEKIYYPSLCQTPCLANIGMFDIYKKCLKKVLDRVKITYPGNLDNIWRAVNVPC